MDEDWLACIVKLNAFEAGGKHQVCVSLRQIFLGRHVHFACNPPRVKLHALVSHFSMKCVLKHKMSLWVATTTTANCCANAANVGSQQLQQSQGPRCLFHNKMHPDHAGQDENGVAAADSSAAWWSSLT